MNLHRILSSLAIVVFAGSAIVAGTGAFFSDTETSSANTFTSGAIDLTVDSEAHYNGHVCVDGLWQLDQTGGASGEPDYPRVGTPCGGTWARTDLGPTNKFFDYGDLKPGDHGENTISLHVENNDAWACAYIENVVSDDNGLTEPEVEAGDADDGAGNGELADEVNFFAWVDDGDNVWEPTSGENPLFSNISGNAITRAYPLHTPAGGVSNTPMAPGQTRYIGLYWCYGAIDTANNALTCNGQPVSNVSQTDTMTADITFYAEQSRNNPDFVCPPAEDVVQDNNGDRRTAVGAALASYDAPACSVTVEVGSSIQSAINGAAPGATVCVGPGTHEDDDYPLRVNKDNMTLASVAGAATTILTGGVVADNDGVKIAGFTIPSSNALGETFGVYINTGADGVQVMYNDLNGPGVTSGRGVVSAIGVTSAVIAQNEIRNYLTGVFLNPSSDMVVELNDLIANGVGSANDNPTNNIVRKNQITGNAVEGVGVLSVGPESLTVTSNNIFGNGPGAGDELNNYGLDAVSAENNWWGDATPADEIGGVGAALVDFTPFELSPFALN